jgi:serine/threonine-protein kinase
MSAEDQAAGALVGSILEGTYRIESLLREGGMGAVYAATHLRLDKRVAVKVMKRELAASPDAIARFHREARVTSALGHPHIVQVLDFSATPSGELFLAMEFLEGEDLDHRLRRVSHLSAETTVRIVKQVASALAATHAKSIVHRDLKPGNIYLLEVAGETDFVKVLDFGISKVRTASTKLTQTTTVMGTPNYMSPEQARGKSEEIDERTDQWALACIAWECLSGESPFPGENIPSILYHIVHQSPPPLLPKVAGLPAKVEEVLSRALSKNKDQRYPSVTNFAEALEAAATSGAAISPCAQPTMRTPDSIADFVPGPGKGLPPNTTFTQTAGEVDANFDVPRTKRWAWGAGAGLAVLLLLAAFSFFRPGPPQKTVTASPSPGSHPSAAATSVAAPPSLPTSPVAVPEPEPKPDIPVALPKAAQEIRTKEPKPTSAMKTRRKARANTQEPSQPPTAPAPPKKDTEDKWRVD